MNTVGMIENVLLRSAEQANGHERSPTRRGCPTRNLQGVLRDQRRVGTGPVRFVRELEFDRRRDVLPYFVFKELLSLRVVLVSLFHAAPHAFKSGKGNAQFSIQTTRAFVELEFRCSQDARVRTRGK